MSGIPALPKQCYYYYITTQSKKVVRYQPPGKTGESELKKLWIGVEQNRVRIVMTTKTKKMLKEWKAWLEFVK